MAVNNAKSMWEDGGMVATSVHTAAVMEHGLDRVVMNKYFQMPVEHARPQLARDAGDDIRVGGQKIRTSNCTYGTVTGSTQNRCCDVVREEGGLVPVKLYFYFYNIEFLSILYHYKSA